MTTISESATAAVMSATAGLNAAMEGQAPSSWLGSLVRLIFWLLQMMTSLLYVVIKLVTITLPTVLFTLFSTSLTFTMNATTL
jgi:lysophospholipid hydrolase